MRTFSTLLAALLALSLLASCASLPTGTGTGGFNTVLIDAGHGGHDSGGTGNGLQEKDMTLDTALKLRDELRARGVRAVLLREDDHFIELDERVAFANRYAGRGAVLVSIHYNAVGGSGPHGAETFYWHPNSHALASRIQRELSAGADLANLGVNRRRLRVTRNPEIPCVLVECAYLTNPAEAARVADAGTRQRIARGIAAGIAQQQQLGDSGITPVAYIPSPLSRPTDARSGGSRETVQ